jgi:DNA (cytosine-5)-methyltransferase 1
VLKHLDLCSGIGGFALGLQSTNYFKTIGFVEIDKFCQKVLTKQFPNIPIYEDLKNFKPQEHNLQPDILTAGFPCQPFSVAGKQKGKDDNRNLWKETFRIIKESRPTWFIGENVSGIVKLYLDTILEDLESEGYTTRCFNISASSIGAKHQRQRIWIVSYSDSRLRGGRGTVRESGIDQEREFSITQEKSKCQTQNLWSKTIGCNALSGETENVSDSNSKRLKELNFSKKSNKQNFDYRRNDKVKTNENWWQTFSKFHRIPNGISYGLDKDRANRIKGLGNAIVPQIPYYIGLAIKKSYE